MTCKHCNTENPDSAVFCGMCGKRLDGNVVCPHCGNLMPEEMNYCYACGARLKAAAQPVQPAQPAAAVKCAPAKSGSGRWKKILEIVGGAVGMAGVFFALLFTFLIGLGIHANGSSGGYDINLGVGDVDLYYYFHDAYAAIAESLGGMTSYSGFYELNVYLLAAFGTLVAAGTIISVLTLSIVTLVRYLRKLLKKSDKDYAPTLIGAILAYILGASLFLGIGNATLSSEVYSDVFVTANTGYNAATAAGIALAVLCLIGFVGCRTAQKGRELGKAKTLVPAILSAVGAVFAGIVWSMATNTAFVFTDASVLSRMSAYNALDSFVSQYVAYNSEPDMAIYLTMLFTLFLQVALAALCTALTAKLMKNLAGNDSSALPLGIAQAAIALVLMLCALLACAFYLQTEELAHYENATSPATIVAFVFSLFLLGITIAHKILRKKFDGASGQTLPQDAGAQPTERTQAVQPETASAQTE